MPSERLLRETVAALQAERDDALAYLGTMRSILETVGAICGLRACAHELAHVLLRHLAVESCALLLLEHEGRQATLLGFATQAERFGAPADRLPLSTWLSAAERCDPGRPITWLRPTPDGTLVDLSLEDLDGESIQILPFVVADELRGMVVLHRLVAPAHRFVHATASRLIAESVGEALTIARTRDVAARLMAQLESQLGSARGALASRDHTLLERERAIAALTDQLVRSDDTKRNFLGAISHELRTPLNAVVGFAHILREDVGDALGSQHREMLEGIIDGGTHLCSLVDDALLLVQLEAGSYRPAQNRVNLSTLVANVLAGLGFAPRATVALEIEVAPEANEIDGVDERLLHRIVAHLLSNAHKFTGEGRVTLRARPHPTAGGLALEIEDTGAGMHPEQLEAMFDLFASGRDARDRATGGLGIGLTLVRRAVPVLGGSLGVESDPGVGTTFRLLLPASLPAATTAAECGA